MSVLPYKFSGKRFLIRDAEGFASRFPAVLPELVHEILSGEVHAELFGVVRSVFGIGAASDVSGAYSAAKSAGEVAAGLGRAEKEVLRVLDIAVEVVKRAMAAPSVGPVVLGDDDLLERFGFKDETDAEIRAYLVMRIGDLRKFLESASDRGDAMRLLQSELLLHFVLSPEMDQLRRTMRATVVANGRVDDSDNAKMAGVQKRMASVEETIDKRKELLGIGEGSSGGVALKDAIQSNIHTLIAAHAAFYAGGDRSYIDGLFTAAEVTVLARPFGDRRGMWRPDVPHLMDQYRAGLHDPKFEVGRMPRALFRSLRKGIANGILQAMSEDEIPVNDLLDGDDDDMEMDGAKASDGGDAAPITAEDMALAEAPKGAAPRAY
jgi:hypothetical protein